MRVAFVIDEYRNPQAGTEGQLQLLAELLGHRGHKVRLAVLRGSEFVRSGRFPAPVDVLSIRRMIDPRGWWRLFRWGRRQVRKGCRVVQIFFNDASIIGPWPLRCAGLRVIVSRRDMGFWYTDGILAGLRLARPAVAALVANSYAAGEAARVREGYSRPKVRVIPNGIVDPAPRTGEPAPLPPPGGRIGVVANIRPLKRLQDLIAAYAKIAGSHSQTDLAIVGGGDASRLREQARQLGVDGRVAFPGQVDDPQGWITTFSVAVLCSESEGLPNAVLEYMRAGLPVVATDTGGIPELVEDGVTGMLVPVGNSEALAAAISSLLDDPLRAARLGRAGRERFERKYSAERMVDAHVELYREVAAGERASAAAGSTRGTSEP